MQRKHTPWTCKECGAYLADNPQEYVRDAYTVTQVRKGRGSETILMTPEKQLYNLQRCMDCDGDNVTTAYDVRTEEEFNSLDYDEQRKVAQGVDEHTPIEVVSAVLRPAMTALNHEDEDYIPAIKVALDIMWKYQELQQ